MRILLLHPEDSPTHGPWTGQGWGRVVDLGLAGVDAYRRWSEFFGCDVSGGALMRVLPGPIRDARAAGLGHVCDAHGIDWWEVLSVRFVQQMYEVLALQRIAAEIRLEDEVSVSRGGLHARVMEILLRRPVVRLQESSGVMGRLANAYKKSRRLSFTRIRQVIADKYDPRHQVRSRFAGERADCKKLVTLLPTAYVNVSRTAVAYADALPKNDFLLVAARESGKCESLPSNVEQADLAAYVRGRPATDYDALCVQWRELKTVWLRNPILSVLAELGAFDNFEESLQQWLAVRDGWLEVFDHEPVSAVLCCDDSNPYSLIPLLIAKNRGIPTMVSHHGALDGQNLFKRSRADFILAKGAMEKDYLVRRCGIERERVVIGAPCGNMPKRISRDKSAIIYFSEDYETSGGRVEEFYRSLLPALATLAACNGKRLIVKLHPAENLRERRRFVKRVLSAQQFRHVELVEGSLTDELLQRAWFAITGISTTAIDCALRGIPVFLCAWLENWPLGYLSQFAEFEAGVKLNDPREIGEIPEFLEDFAICDPRNLWQPIEPERLQEILAGGVEEMSAAI